ncbi:MAG: DsrE/DsrF/DrsH-like family protein [Chloroflexota bacterium]|nr:DsrE/DsrF/DrsH-like family protein [Chloroflexota bacterium]
MAQLAITVNSAEPSSAFPTMIIGSAAAACGHDVTLFFTPGGSPLMVKGELERLRDMKIKGMPDIVELYDGLCVLGGKIMVCELCFTAKDLKAEDMRDEAEIVGATTFIGSLPDSTISFSF